MSNTFKKQNHVSGGLYIALAICILSVICIGVYSAILNIFDTPVADNPIVEEKNKVPSTTTKNGALTTTPKGTAPSASTLPPVTSQVPEASVSVGNEKNEPEHDVNATPTPPSYTMPVAGELTVAFSNDILVYSETMNDYRLHNGLDLAAAIGTPVKAFTDGVVTEIYTDPLMGHTVVLDHGGDLKSVYQNLSEQLPEGIEIGAEVEEGQVIGGIGETTLIECAQTPHLHFEVISEGKAVNPMTWFE